MKVLWYVNIIMPAAGQRLGLKTWVGGGWLIGQADALTGSDVQLVILNACDQVQEIKTAVVDSIRYIVIPAKSNLQTVYTQILKEEQPDIVHVFGTENIYNTTLVQVCADTGVKSVISMQGIMVECARHYSDGMPEKFNRINPVIKLMKKLYYAESVALEKQLFEQQGCKETEALKACTNVIGRTHWDKAYVTGINPNIEYFHVNENLRAEFYTDEAWDYDRCEKHSLFFSQAAYPIKGFHQVIPALAQLAKEYPDLKVYISGRKPYTLNNNFLDIFVDYFFEYQKYIKKLIKEYNLSEVITYTGPLSAQQMKERYLSSNVFVSASTVENSPNSVGEAMILGVPVVASNVGGVSSMVTDGIDGLLYDFFDTEGFISCVREIFDNREKAEYLSENARKHARATHDKKINTEQLFNTYNFVRMM